MLRSALSLLLLLLLLRCQADARPAANQPVIHLECSVCKNFVQLARKLVDDGQKNLVPEVAKLVCLYKFKEASQVCDGVVKLWEPLALFVVNRIYLEPERLCGQLLGNSCSNSSIPELNEMWNVSLPSREKPPVRPPTPPPPGSKRLRVLHLSDIHVDIFYSVGAAADCRLPVCCRFSDADPSKSKRRASYWGDYNCDQPWWVLQRVFHQIARDVQLDLIYFTGDLPDHHVWEQTRQQQTQLYSNFTKLVRECFPSVPFVAALGNHESLPVNSFPPRYISGEQSIDWLYQQVWHSMQHWLPEDQKQNVLRGGYYTQLLRPGLRVVSLNVNFGNNLNWWVLQNITDPDGQLQWLVNVLQQAEDTGEKVHILGHIPPNQLLKGYSWNYFKIAHRYESTIAGHFYGHTHLDNFGVFFDPENKTRAFGSVFVMGSLKATGNPSFRVYEVDADRPNATWQVLDYSNFIFNLTEANARGSQQDPKWQLEYRPTAAYGMEQTFPRDWAELIKRFETDNQLFQKFYMFHQKMNMQPGQKPCTGDCKRKIICGMRNQRTDDRTFPC